MIPYKKLLARIERDKQKKAARHAPMFAEYDNLDKAVTFRHYVRSLRKCNKNVSFKLSVQNYNAVSISKIGPDCNAVRKCDVPPISSSKKVKIKERGHTRIITPIHISDRMTQRVLCDYALVPMIERRLIYDNGASMKNKGVSFARNRFNAHLEKAKAKWGDDFYALVFDFKSFFDSVPHKLCYDELCRTFRDKRLVDVTMQVIESYQIRDAKKNGDTDEIARLRRHEGTGICLGSQVSQIMALVVPNEIDHYFKDVLGIKFYRRYMDDGVIFHQSKELLNCLLVTLEKLSNKLGLRLNRNKTHIAHIRKGVTFLKIRYIVRGTRTIKLLTRAGTVRMRRKLKKFVHLVAEGKMSLNDVYNSVQSWLSHAKLAKSFHAIRRMMALYDKLFGGYRLTKKWRCAAA